MKALFSGIIGLLAYSCSIFAQEAVQNKMTPKDQAMLLLQKIEADNNQYLKSNQKSFFNSKIGHHQPNVTFIGCSDARVQTAMFNSNSEGTVFTIRNIGNQITTAKGSVKYGINHLNTPLLLIIGHTECGAVIAARSDYSQLEPSLKEELDSLHIQKNGTELDAIKENVNHQVNAALKLFANKVDHDELLIVGAIYDFSNAMKKGSGKLNIINIQGKKLGS